jgi:hypothetical protein
MSASKPKIGIYDFLVEEGLAEYTATFPIFIQVGIFPVMSALKPIIGINDILVEEAGFLVITVASPIRAVTI